VATAVAVRLVGDAVGRVDRVLHLLRRAVRRDRRAAIGTDHGLVGRVALRGGRLLLGLRLGVALPRCGPAVRLAAHEPLLPARGAAVGAAAQRALEAGLGAAGLLAELAVGAGPEAGTGEIALEQLHVGAARPLLERPLGVARLRGGRGEHGGRGRKGDSGAPRARESIPVHLFPALSSVALPGLADGLARKESRYRESRIRPNCLVPPATRPPERTSGSARFQVRAAR
jgi:hypothetical protein